MGAKLPLNDTCTYRSLKCGLMQGFGEYVICSKEIQSALRTWGLRRSDITELLLIRKLNTGEQSSQFSCIIVLVTFPSI